MAKLINGDCLKELKNLKDNSIDTMITDPPYGLSFMGKKWDYDVPKIEIWKECLRVLKPGGTALIFAGSRTQHRMAINVEDAGFILKDTIMYLYGSGFPKAADISKQLDKTVGVKRNRIEVQKAAKDSVDYGKYSGEIDDNNAITPKAKLWQGWKSHSLKPAYEPILVAVKPNDGTYANNALKWGVSGLNIDGGRIGINGGTKKGNPPKEKSNGIYGDGINGKCDILDINKGRFPSNIILDEEAGKMLDEQSGVSKSTGGRIGKKDKSNINFGPSGNYRKGDPGYGDKGGASRFFYCAKASKKERDMGCEDLSFNTKGFRPGEGLGGQQISMIRKNSHPTVKPLSLLKYLCTLTKTPTGGIVLDPFMGSGTTGIACKITMRDFIGIELEPEYFKIAEARINNFKVEEKIKKDKRQLEIPMWNNE